MGMLSLRIYTDGGARGNPGPAGAGAVLKRLLPDGTEREVLATVSDFLGEMTNNQAEYEAIIRGLEKARVLGAETVELVMDSELAAKQIRGEYRVKNAALAVKFLRVHDLLSGFQRFTVRHIPRERNLEADALVNRAMDRRF